MGKKADNKVVIATPELRRKASAIADARRYARQWKARDEKLSTEMKEEIGPDVTLVTEDNREVASNVETIKTEVFDYAKYFEDHPAEKALLERDYRKDPTTSQTLTTKWNEPLPQPQAPAQQAAS